MKLEFRKVSKKELFTASFNRLFINDTVVLGAQIIERHITLDKSLWGTDQQSSIEPLGFARLIRDTRVIEKSLGIEKKLFLKMKKK